MPSKCTCGQENRLSHEEFTLRAIKSLRKENYKGIHSVFSGFNEAFREYFQEDPVEAMNKLEAEGKIAKRPAKKGFLLFDAAELEREKIPAPRKRSKVLEAILKKPS